MPDVTKSRIFPAGPGCAALEAARDWCLDNGFDYGHSDDGAPIGIAGDGTFIGQWRGLGADGVEQLSGRMEPVHGEHYSGDGVILTLRTDLIPETEDPGAWT